MLGIGNSVSGPGSPLPLETRAAVGAGILPTLTQADSSSSSASFDSAGLDAASAQRIPAYNAFEFIYRQDYGKIVLLEQNGQTGQEVTQIPTEYHLQQYAAQQRAQHVTQQQQLLQGSQSGSGKSGRGPGTPTPSGGTSGTGGGGTSASGTGVRPAVAPTAPPPAQPAAPALTAAPAPTHVDIKV
jgi:hypothetical protein